MSDCPQCGQKLRPQWVRCPRCRQLLADVATVSGGVSTTADASSAWPRRSWLVAATGGATALILIATLMRSETPAATAAVASRSASEPRTTAAGETSVERTMEGSDGSRFDAAESKRAATVAYSSGDLSTALTQLEAAVAAAPDDHEARNNLGQVLVRHGRAADALVHFDEAVRLNGQTWDYRFNRARAYGLLNRWPEAVGEYRAAAQLFPEDHATLYNLGLALIRVRDYTAAAQSLEQAVAAAPDQHDFLITLGTAYVGAQQHDRARATFERFLQVAPNDPEAAKVKALLQSLSESAP